MCNQLNWIKIELAHFSFFENQTKVEKKNPFVTFDLINMTRRYLSLIFSTKLIIASSNISLNIHVVNDDQQSREKKKKCVTHQ